MKRFIIIFFLLCFLACDNTTQNSITIEDEEKASLVVKVADMYFMDVYISRSAKNDRDSLRTKLESEFLQLHGQTVKELDSYLDNLKNDKKLFTEVMDSVSNLLNTKSINNKNK